MSSEQVKELFFMNEIDEECKDLLNSNVFIEDFNTLIQKSEHSVYAITGDWGTGKTSFVKMWKNKFLSENDCIYIDAFKMDYESDPFMMFIKEFKKFIEKNIKNGEIEKEKLLNKAKEIFTLKNMLKLGFNIVVDKTIGMEPVKDFLNNAYNSCFDELSKEQTLYDELKSSLEIITEKLDTILYIIIDELDRCRPDFALETLERIKHLFSVKNIKYILVYNEKVMKGIIHRKYGIEIDAKRYLDKFVQKSYILNNTNSYSSWYFNEFNKIFKNVSSGMYDFLQSNSENFLSIGRTYSIRLRDIQQILKNLVQISIYNDGKSCASLATVEILKYANEDEFNALVRYYYENRSSFSSNAPSRVNLNKIYRSFKVPHEEKTTEFTEAPDKAFYFAMQYYDKQLK